ncbi:hypothetical protein H1X69_12355 [Streptomyces griseoaurantiacus]|uniref:Lipoprotein n=1 Tax=Streptomyces griseoaurantiacus TaxID=68213 RepID=A0A7W2DSH5_9ACTN|nr:hypothetical protein [Streptomyces griseoaurantiacus]
MNPCLFLLLILLLAAGCSVGEPGKPIAGGRTTASTPAPEAVVRITQKAACARVDVLLDGLETPLELLADGTTPVSWSDDFRQAAPGFHQVGREGPGAVGYFAEGLGGDLDRLVPALEGRRTAEARAVGEVVTNRVRNLRNACK